MPKGECMRTFVVWAAVAIVLLSVTVASAVVIVPGEDLVCNGRNPNDPQVRIRIRPQKQWQETYPCTFNPTAETILSFSGRLPDVNTQGRVWFSYPDLQGQTVETSWEIIYPKKFLYQVQLPFCPSEVTVHFVNRFDRRLVIQKPVFAALQITPDPATLGLVAVACAGLFRCRRI